MESNWYYHRCIQEFKPHLNHGYQHGDVWICPYCNKSWTYIYNLTDVPRIKWKNTEWTKNRGVEMSRMEINISAEVRSSESEHDIVSGILKVFKDKIPYGAKSQLGTVKFTGPDGNKTYELNANGFYRVQSDVKVW